ncbi:DUF3263 domain-containing protein [Micromonospora endophytica]|uniref:DUF3263 domain-containing protein n=1 Tax=Micromonospora endophytica TaxID=515350 RepID=A0A2W2D6C4_9ACTN|nr:DUF3263 domain-containing protein [Micromonospora endophytica]PZF99268.1 DUF3263 domain-containing protein [Micromonospora endophytica]RIW48728.1 DUF3263 domain-containing protein [Micromonospora endophytica]BCJ59935.1 hypothetical protein Jiend_33570 [Micromonospora endophytica]
MQPADATPAAETTDAAVPLGAGPETAAVPPPRTAPEAQPGATRQVQPPSGTPDDAEPVAGGPGATGVADALDERNREILAFERQWWRHAGAKEQAIRDRFGLSATRYYQLLNALLDNPAALAADPVLVGRLLRLRASRTRNRRR